MLYKFNPRRLLRIAPLAVVPLAVGLAFSDHFNAAAAAWLVAAQQETSPGQQPGFPGRQPGIPGGSRTGPIQPMIPPIGTGRSMSRKQKDAIVNENFEQTKKDVSQLSKLVQTLQQQVNKSRPDVLSLQIVRQAKKIEKLAKKIGGEAKAY